MEMKEIALTVICPTRYTKYQIIADASKCSGEYNYYSILQFIINVTKDTRMPMSVIKGVTIRSTFIIRTVIWRRL